MLLAIDIGNTSINMGIFNKKRIVKTMSIKTNAAKKDVLNFFKKSFIARKFRIEYVIISSVVPKALANIKYAAREVISLRPLVTGKQIKVPIKNLYNIPEQVGQDRLVNAFACKELYGYPAIVLDFGTATTLDYINKDGAYEGGIITPGVAITIEALAKKTALLPKIKLARPASLIGRDTTGSIRSGIVYGLSAMCDALIEKIRKNYKNKPVVVATGGLADVFCHYSNNINKIDKNLTFKGLQKIFEKTSPGA